MDRWVQARMAAVVCMVMLLALQGVARSQDTPTFVETGVIFSAQQVERSRSVKYFDGMRPLWTPSPEEIARLESKLQPYLEDVANGKMRSIIDYWLAPYNWRAPSQAKEIVAQLASYKRQYFGVTYAGKKWVFVNAFCEEYLKEEEKLMNADEDLKRKGSWRDRLVLVFDGGSCFFTVLYDPSGLQFDELWINGPA